MSKSNRFDNEIKSYYDIIPDKFKNKSHNPQYGISHLIKIPSSIMIIGGSGSGKTQLLLELLRRMQKTFQKIYLVCKSAHEPLYEYLASKLSSKVFFIYEGLESATHLLEEIDPKEQNLVVFDDLINEKNQYLPEEVFIRGRKRNITRIYITQSYFKTSKTIRVNTQYFFLKRLSSVRDLNMILSDFALDITKQELHKLYDYSTKKKTDFLLIDTESNNFFHNFLELLHGSVY